MVLMLCRTLFLIGSLALPVSSSWSKSTKLENVYLNYSKFEEAIVEHEKWDPERLLLLDAPIFKQETKGEAQFLLSRDHCGRSFCKTYLLDKRPDGSLKVIGLFKGQPSIQGTSSHGRYDLLIELNQGNKKEFEFLIKKYKFDGELYNVKAP